MRFQRSIVLLLLVSALVGCATYPVVLTSTEDVSRYVGKKVTLVGEVSNSKVPEILGVDVESANNPDLRGKLAEATGVLERWEVTDKQIEEMNLTLVAHRGTGVFYRLRSQTGVRERT